MRIFALSDIHIDYQLNAKWIANISAWDYQNDILILAGDVTDRIELLAWCIAILEARFKKVLFVPGNHEIWVSRDRGASRTSLQKFREVIHVVESSGASTKIYRAAGIAFIPLFGWYDFSFGQPCVELKSTWMDFVACRWPDGFAERERVEYFTGLNDLGGAASADKVITFSHFLPRIDLMPSYIQTAMRFLYPVLGSVELERQLRHVRSSIHVYGHSHVNRKITIDGVNYVNNAFGYPCESHISSKQLVCIHE